MLLISICFPTYGQRFDKGQNINLSLGYVKKGVNVGIGYEKFLSRQDAIFFEFDYSDRSASLRTHEQKANLSDYFVTAAYRRYFNMGKFFPYFGIGIFGGYQNFRNKANFPPSILIERENGGLFGVHPEVGLEANFGAFSVNLAFVSRYEFLFEDFLPEIRLGVKYYF